MFPEMRRTTQQLSREESIGILSGLSTGVLAVIGENGYPYSVPLNYAYSDNKIYFHCAVSGHKLDAIANNERVSFCVIDHDELDLPGLTTVYRSVIVFGTAKILSNTEEKQAAATLFWRRICSDQKYMEKGLKSIQDTWDSLCMVEIDIEHMTGKASRRLIK